jgi:hypothetical protein
LFAHAFVLFLVLVFPLTPDSYAQHQLHFSVLFGTHPALHLPSASQHLSAICYNVMSFPVEKPEDSQKQSLTFGAGVLG